ncbi:MAG: hypothetical protein NVSMB67_19630 [Flavisolibacter sp.]
MNNNDFYLVGDHDHQFKIRKERITYGPSIISNFSLYYRFLLLMAYHPGAKTSFGSGNEKMDENV